jgi:hypothetical protein
LRGGTWVLLWNQIKQRKINGLDFDRQRAIGNYIFLAQRQSHPANLNSKRPSPEGNYKALFYRGQFEILKTDENR